MTRLVALDPGSKKCGLLLVDLEKALVLDGKVVECSHVVDLIMSWRDKGDLKGIVLGNGTSSNFWYMKLESFFSIEVVEEKGTTLRARKRYWELFPMPRWLNWLPKGLFVPSKPLDAIAALILLEDYLEMKLHWSEPMNFKIWPEP